MDQQFKGRLILVVEDQPLVALDIKQSLIEAGALVLTAATLQEGLRLAKNLELAAAILGLALGSEDAEPLCARLSARGIPFVVYSGYSELPSDCRAGVIISKPATPTTLLGALAHMLLP